MKYPAWVYTITILGVPKVYVGLSSDPKKRFAQHESALRAGRHPVEDMQADYDTSNKKLFFCPLEEVKTKSERFKEHKWQLQYRSYDRKYGYNYKDPTARVETARAEQRKQYIAFQKDRIRKVVYAHREPPIPLSKKRRMETAEALKELAALSDAELEEFLDAIRKGYI